MTNQIKTITLNTGNWVLVEIPKKARNLKAIKNTLRWKADPLKFWWDQAILPAGHTYTLIGKAKYLSEEQWKGIVENSAGWFDKYKNYQASEFIWTAKESGISLLKSQGIDIETTVILKQND